MREASGRRQGFSVVRMGPDREASCSGKDVRFAVRETRGSGEEIFEVGVKSW